MGCVNGINVSQQRPEVRGYSMQSFIDETLIPVDSFVCLMPPEATQSSLGELAEKLHGYHKRKMELYQTGRVVSCSPKVPANALCKVRLTRGDYRARAGAEINLEYSAHAVEVRFTGALASCDSEWSGPPCGDDEHALDLMPRKDGEKEWKVNVQVWCLIQHNSSDAVKLAVKHTVVKVCGDNGDPMVESWLRVEDLMKCLSLILNKNLAAGIVSHAQDDEKN